MEDLNPARPPFLHRSMLHGRLRYGCRGLLRQRRHRASSGLAAKLANDLSSTGPASAMLLERDLELQPDETRTLCFLYGYLPQGFSAGELVKKYSADPAHLWSRSSAAWKADAIRFSVPTEPWVEREILWHNYYLRSSLTYDSFFREHIVSQGQPLSVRLRASRARRAIRCNIPCHSSSPIRRLCRRNRSLHAQGDTARWIDPLRHRREAASHALQFVPGDLELWLLWTVAEYVLATRDKEFLQERVPTYSHREASPTDPTIGELLRRSYMHLTQVIGVGKHGLIRIVTGDWNDTRSGWKWFHEE